MSKLKYDKTKFKSEEEYKKFLEDKMNKMMNKIKNTPELLDVFKRLNNK
jgi:hypothetical protein